MDTPVIAFRLEKKITTECAVEGGVLSKGVALSSVLYGIASVTPRSCKSAMGGACVRSPMQGDVFCDMHTEWGYLYCCNLFPARYQGWHLSPVRSLFLSHQRDNVLLPVQQ